MKTLTCVLFAALALSAADVNVTGEWSGNATMTRPDGQTREQPVVFTLKQNGSDVTGTAAGGGDQQQFPIQKGKVDGDKISFEIQTDGPLVKFDLVVAGDKLKGEGSATQGDQTMKVKIDLTRSKA